MTRIVRTREAREAVDSVRARGRRVVTFFGFSGGGYEHPEAVDLAISNALLRLQPDATLICSGATADGIGVVYRIAKDRGFETIGIVSSIAEREGATYSEFVDTIYVIEDDSWGGLRDDGRLSPTSEAMVGASDELIAIGGGTIARAEIEAARKLAKPVAYVAAEMNHAAAIQKAARNGEPAPREFKGPVDNLLGGL